MTVSELIEALRQMPPDAPVIITDADTGWDIVTIHMALGKTSTERYAAPRSDTVYLWGEYDEMQSN